MNCSVKGTGTVCEDRLYSKLQMLAVNVVHSAGSMVTV